MRMMGYPRKYSHLILLPGKNGSYIRDKPFWGVKSYDSDSMTRLKTKLSEQVRALLGQVQVKNLHVLVLNSVYSIQKLACQLTLSKVFIMLIDSFSKKANFISSKWRKVQAQT